MARKIKYDTYMTADTESNKDGSLYLISSYNPIEGGKVFYNLESFYEYVETLGNVIIYIHNMANWDSYFMFRTEKVRKYEIINRINKQKKLLSITFRDKKGFDHNRNPIYQHIKMEDSYPRTVVSLKGFAKSIGEPYDELPSYDTYREPNKPETWIDRVEIEEYAIKDVVILWKLIETFKAVYGESFSKSLSAGSMVWMEMIGQYSDNPRWAHKAFRQRFTALDQNIDSIIRPSFMGGITSPFWNNGVTIDRLNIKTLYPWFKDPIIMSDDISSAYAWAQIKELPHGKYTMRFEDDMKNIKTMIHQRNEITFFAIKYSYTRAKFPLIPKLHMAEVDEYTVPNPDRDYKYNTKSEYMETMLNGSSGIAAVSTLDMRKAIENNVYENFTWEVIPFINQTHENPLWGISFAMKKSPEMFNITMKYYDLKNNAPSKALRTAYKSPLVNLFGKTGERFYETDNELDIFTWEYSKDVLLDTALSPRYSNVAVAATITSYVHHKLYEKAAEVGFKNMLYCDTDSMFYVSENKPLVIEETVLGSWDNETYNPDRALFICAKKYIVENKTDKGWERIKSASAGILKDDLSFNIDNFESGVRTFKTRLKKLVPNGVILVDDTRDITNSFTDGDTFTYEDYTPYE